MPSPFCESCDIVFNRKVRKGLFPQGFLHILLKSKVLHGCLRVIPTNQCIPFIFLRVSRFSEGLSSPFCESCDNEFNRKVRKGLFSQGFLHILLNPKIFAKS